eukprot:TRINITY_DN10220_c0_g1_i1.p1 TRINITY_DN10220_c0_g1~~TRINITY_DN10220_c0_g1_i1.p1  ORF type:complete len:702 (+),score=187.25 TRINITY_DN10220_c0_g1_i1:153-2258(+)
MDCPFKIQGCDSKVPRADLEKHRKICLHRPEMVAKQKQQNLEKLKAKRDKVLQQEESFDVAEEEFRKAFQELRARKKSIESIKDSGQKRKLSEVDQEKAALINRHKEASAKRKKALFELAVNLLELAKECHSMGDLRESTKLVNRAISLLGDDDEPEEESKVEKAATKSGTDSKEEKEEEKEEDTSAKKNAFTGTERWMAKAEAYNLLAMLYGEDAKYKQALAECAKAVAIALRFPTIPSFRESLADYYVTDGDIYAKFGDYEVAERSYTEALSCAKGIPAKDRSGTLLIKIAATLNAIGIIHKKRSNYDAAIKAYNDGLGILTKHAKGVDSEECDKKEEEISVNLADVYRKKGEYEKARELYERSLAKIKSAYGSANHPDIADISNSLGMLEKKVGNYKEALQHYNNALKIGKLLFGNNHPNVGMYLVNIGDIHRKLGEYKKAEGIYIKALQTLEHCLGEDHPEVAEVLNSMGLVSKKRALYDKAEPLYVRAIAIIRKKFGEQHYKIGIYMNNLGDVERKRGNYKNALRIYDEAMKAICATLGKDHSEAGEILHNQGQVHHKLGDFDKACDLYEQALKIVRKEFGKKHYKVGMFLNNLGLANAMRKKFDEAYRQMKEALQILIHCLGTNHVEVADVHANIGDVAMKLFVEKNQQDKLSEARSHYVKANSIIEKALGKDHTKCNQFASLLFICDNYSSMMS